MMAGQGEFQATTQSGAVDGSHHRFATGFQRTHIGLQAVDHVFKLFGLFAGHCVQLIQVAAGKEAFLGGGNDNAFDIIQVAFDLVDGFG